MPETRHHFTNACLLTLETCYFGVGHHCHYFCAGHHCHVSLLMSADGGLVAPLYWDYHLDKQCTPQLLSSGPTPVIKEASSLRILNEMTNIAQRGIQCPNLQNKITSCDMVDGNVLVWELIFTLGSNLPTVGDALKYSHTLWLFFPADYPQHPLRILVGARASLRLAFFMQHNPSNPTMTVHNVCLHI